MIKVILSLKNKGKLLKGFREKCLEKTLAFDYCKIIFLKWLSQKTVTKTQRLL